jgi:hypothetical protein
MTEKSTRIDAPEPVAYSIERPGGLPGAEVLVKDLPTTTHDDGLRERAALAALTGIMANPVRWQQIADDYKSGKKTYEQCSMANAVKAWGIADAFIAAKGAGR